LTCVLRVRFLPDLQFKHQVKTRLCNKLCYKLFID
jgi:hypothetical protein